MPAYDMVAVDNNWQSGRNPEPGVTVLGLFQYWDGYNKRFASFLRQCTFYDDSPDEEDNGWWFENGGKMMKNGTWQMLAKRCDTSPTFWCNIHCVHDSSEETESEEERLRAELVAVEPANLG